MRWEELFDDLEGQLEAATEAELAAEVADRGRREMGLVRLVDRLRPALGGTVGIRVRGAGPVEGVLAAVGPDWLLVGESHGREVLVATSAVVSITGLAAQSATGTAHGAVEARLRLGYALRGVVRDRSAVTIVLVDGATMTGTLDRVGEDFAEVAEHPLGELRRRTAVRAVRTFPLTALAAIRRLASA